MWYIILTILLGLYILTNNILTKTTTEIYIIQPILWIALAIITTIIAKQDGLNIIKFKRIKRWYLGKTPTHAGLMIGGFHVAILIIVGILFGFGTSPYAHTPIAIARNAFFITALILGTEISRAYLIKKGCSKKKYTTAVLVLTAILFLIISINTTQFEKLLFTNPEKTLEFIGATLITLLAINVLASYLSYLGGAAASIPYILTITAFEWFSPILPNPHWTMLALAGTIAPAIGFAILQNTIEPFLEGKKHKKFKTKHSSGQEWTLIAVFGLILIFFSYGYLGVTPVVIYSGSMQPEYQVGDMVIIDEIPVENIREGDVIQFVRDNMTIMHRVQEIELNQQGERTFVVKGDANKDPDPEPVIPAQIKGKAVFKIPKIGWIQIYIKETLKDFS